MTKPGYQNIAYRGLNFFGEMTASVSHEIKNCLAIMNESAGLIQDLVMLNSKGKPLVPEQIDRMSIQITNTIKRADTIVKNLNGFAHSVDMPEKSLNLTEILSMSLSLAQRFATKYGVSLDLISSKEKIIITTHPFFFMHLIWQCLDFAMTTSGPEKIIKIIPSVKANIVEINFQKLEAVEKQNLKVGFYEKNEILLNELCANINFSNNQTEMCLKLKNKLKK